MAPMKKIILVIIVVLLVGVPAVAAARLPDSLIESYRNPPIDLTYSDMTEACCFDVHENRWPFSFPDLSAPINNVRTNDDWPAPSIWERMRTPQNPFDSDTTDATYVYFNKFTNPMIEKP